MAYDIFYVSKNIINEQDWKQFRLRFPSAQKIDNVASFDDIKKKAFTRFFWIIWDDLTLIDLSIFNFKVSKFEEEFIHVFKNRCNSVESYFGGVVLFPKNCTVSLKEFQHRFYLNKKEHDVVVSEYRYPISKLTTYDAYLKFATSNPHPLFWGVWADIEIINEDIFNLYFDPNDGKYDYDRSENHVYKNSCNNVESYLSGVVLFSTKKIISQREFNIRFLVDKKEHDIVVSKYRYPRYVINNYQEYQDILKNETQQMFWCIWPDIEIINEDIFNLYFDLNDGKYDYDRNTNHLFLNNTSYDGLILASKNKLISKKEFDHRFLVDKKEWSIVASKPKQFDVYYLNSYKEFLSIKESATSEMFWVVWNDVDLSKDFAFDYYVPVYDTFHRNITHIFKNNEFYDGICLFSKHKDISKNEFDHRFFIDKVEVDVVASTPKQYDQHIINNHDDYLVALNSSQTEMFWGIWSNINVTNQKIFDTYFSHHDRQSRTENHAFKNVCNGQESFVNGIILFSKNTPVSKKEIEYRYLFKKKEYDIVASQNQYPKYIISNYTEYLNVCQTEKQPLFWCVWPDVEVIDSEIFDFYFDPNDGKYDYDRSENHVYKNSCNGIESYLSGIVLFSTKKIISEKEFNHRFLVDKKEHDLVISKYRYSKYIIHSYQEYQDILKNETQQMFWCVWPDIDIIDNTIFDFYFDPNDGKYDYDRSENHVYKNSCNGIESYLSGVILFSTEKAISQKEFNHRFLIDKKEYDLVVSKYRYPRYVINTYQEYQDILKNETQQMFWCIWPDVEVIDSEIFDFYFDPFDGQYDYDRSENHVYKNKIDNDESFISGITLCSTAKMVSKKEFDHRFFIDKKERNQVISRSKPYDKFIIEKFEDYKHALEMSTTDMFWAIPPEVEPLEDFKFDLQFPYQNDHERSINHVFKNKDVEDIKYNGIMLLSKQAPISAREIEHRYLIEKKEYDIVASKLKLYDIVFISYNEPNADENFIKLQGQFPRAKQVHGVKGIHQAHIAAAKLSTTPMFWAVDGDAVIEDNFKFNLLLPRHDTDIVHVWLSRNPVNNLKYGYGGVKLLPKHLTENMDIDQIDMTMSISNKFKVVQEVSNITAFNTDPFNTWKSAFRECVKLASRPLTQGYQEETEDRLITWCNIGVDQSYGEYALAGARAGKQFGIDNIANPEQLVKINDFDWLQEQFQNQSLLVNTP